MGTTEGWLTSLGHMAAALNLETLNLESTLSFLILVVAWSLVRPAMLRDYDNRRLPYNTTARVAFSSAWALIFIALTITLHFFVSATETIAGAIPPPFQGLLTSFKGQPPLLAAITLGGLLQFAFFRDIERSAVVWLHSRRHIHDDMQALTQHLERCAFEPSAGEQSKNRDSLKKYGIYLTDETLGGIGLVTVDRWRKVASLVRVLHEWNTDDDHVLGQEDMQHLAEIATAHERKTELAMTIVKLLEAQGGEASKALSAMLKLLAETPHVDRASVEAAEARAKIIVSRASDEVSQRPLRISGEELKRHLAQIESYFEIEYQLLLQRLADLAAKSVVLAGERAPSRLDQLRQAGFAGLGRIERISLDRILWLFLVVTCGGFLVMFMGYHRTMTPQMAEGLARFAFVMSVAALIGAAVGSHRRHARAPDTPWGAYFGAGIGAGAIFVGVTLIANLIKISLAGGAAAQQPAWTMERILPWAFLPCLVTVAIARLARLETWPELHRLRSFQNIGERFADGLCVAFAVFVADGIALAVHAPLGIALPPQIEEALKTAVFPIPIPWALLGLGFLIGFFVVRDVRRAAHGTIIARPARAEAAAEPVQLREPVSAPAQLQQGAS